MKFSIEDKNLVINHLMLNQKKEIVMAIADSPNFKENKDFELKILINGVEIEFAETFEKMMNDEYNNMVEKLKTEYDVDNFDRRVVEKAELLIKNKFEDLREKMYEFENCLDFGIDDVYK